MGQQPSTHLRPASAATRERLRALLVAEAAGADNLWVSDHLLVPRGSDAPPEAFHDPLAVLTWAVIIGGIKSIPGLEEPQELHLAQPDIDVRL